MRVSHKDLQDRHFRWKMANFPRPRRVVFPLYEISGTPEIYLPPTIPVLPLPSTMWKFGI